MGKRKAPPEPVKGGWDVLPHNLGILGQHPQSATPAARVTRSQTKVLQSLTEPHTTKHPVKPGIPRQDGNQHPRKGRPKKHSDTPAAVKAEVLAHQIGTEGGDDAALPILGESSLVPLDATRIKTEEETQEDPNKAAGPVKTSAKWNKRKAIDAPPAVDDHDLEDSDYSRPPKKRARKAKPKVAKEEANKDTPDDTPSKTAAKQKRQPKGRYGLTPGISPFPDWPSPTVAECEEVHRLLSEAHGQVTQPVKIPAPSLTVAGCGEVPSVLDAVIRTVLSAATTMSNSNAAFAKLAETYGMLKAGVGKGSVDWNSVRLSPLEKVIRTIHCGGLANTKGKTIKGILQRTFELNLERREAYQKEKATGDCAGVVGAQEKTQGQKDLEILKTDQDILSLDHLHGMKATEAMEELTEFPGVGVKTASCVLLFCLQLPSFAVDTHIFRLCKWLRWVPEKATRDQTFSHCEVHIPDHLKYGLHQLFIRHGKTCGRCRAITSEGTEGWETVNCPLEHLLERTGKRKSDAKLKKAAKKNTDEAKSKSTPSNVNDGGDEESELSELSDMEAPEGFMNDE